MPDPSPVPPEAVTLGAIAMHDDQCDDGDTKTCPRWNSALPGDYDRRRHIGYYEDRARPVAAAAAPAIRADERARLAALGGECITPCDDDCELRPDGCHEEHQPNHGDKRPHQPWACKDIRAAIGAATEDERERTGRILTDHARHNRPCAACRRHGRPWVPLINLLNVIRDGF
jgi:hypothetical protein